MFDLLINILLVWGTFWVIGGLITEYREVFPKAPRVKESNKKERTKNGTVSFVSERR